MKRETYIDLDAAGRAAFIDAQIMKRFGVSARARLAQPFRSTPLKLTYLEMSPEDRAAFLDRQIARRAA